MKDNSILNIVEIGEVFREYCKETNTKFSKVEFKKFLEFLQIDLYDWINGNLRYYYN